MFTVPIVYDAFHYAVCGPSFDDHVRYLVLI